MRSSMYKKGTLIAPLLIFFQTSVMKQQAERQSDCVDLMSVSSNWCDLWTIISALTNNPVGTRTEFLVGCPFDISHYSGMTIQKTATKRIREVEDQLKYSEKQFQTDFQYITVMFARIIVRTIFWNSASSSNLIMFQTLLRLIWAINQKITTVSTELITT